MHLLATLHTSSREIQVVYLNIESESSNSNSVLQKLLFPWPAPLWCSHQSFWFPKSIFQNIQSQHMHLLESSSLHFQTWNDHS